MASTNQFLNSYGIKLYDNPQLLVHPPGQDKAQCWLFVLIDEGRCRYSRTGTVLDTHSSILLQHSHEGISGMEFSVGFKGTVLSVPDKAMMQMKTAKNLMFYASISTDPCKKLNTRETAQLKQYLKLIRSAQKERVYYDTDEEILCLSEALFRYCLKFYENPDVCTEINRPALIANDFIKLVSQHCRTERKMVFYSKKLSVSIKYLSAVVSSSTGKKASEWISEYTIINAKQFLDDPVLSINEVSDRMGFITPSDFSKYFRRNTGITPKDYRKSSKNL